MAYIKINFSGVSELNRNVKKTGNEICRAESELLCLRLGVSEDIQARYNIYSRLKACSSSLEELHARSNKLLALLESGLHNYEETESRLCREAPNESSINARSEENETDV